MKPSNGSLLHIIADRYKTSDAVFVFPSEIVARSWRSYLLNQRVCKVVEAGRFVSWDHFKTKAFSIRSEKTPINSLARKLFLKLFLSDEQQIENLRYLVNPQFPEAIDSMQSYIAQVLPKLPFLIEALEKKSVQDTGKFAGFALLLEDLKYLQRNYQTYLDTQNYFEANWEAVLRNTADTTHYLLVYPHLLDDYDRFTSFLEKDPLFEIVIETRLDTSKRTLNWFEHSKAEIKQCMKSIQELLISGVEAADIAITVASLAQTQKDLEQEAKINGIHLRNMKGEFLSEQISVRMFSLLQKIRSDRYSFSTLLELFANQAIPWKDRNWSEIITIGREQAVLKEEKSSKFWLSVLAKHSPNQAQSFKNFLTSTQKLLSSSTPNALKQSCIIFLDQFMNKDGWSLRNEQSLQRALVVLDELDQAWSPDLQGKLNPFSLWIELLAETLYVAQNNTGIAVYPYRVSAGLALDHHFVLNLNAKSVYISASDLPFIPEYMKKNVTTSTGDLTKAYLKAYWESSGNVYFSGAQLNKEGTQAIAPYFLSKPRKSQKTRDWVDPEEDFWRSYVQGKETSKAQLSSYQAESIQELSQRSFFPMKNFFAHQLDQFEFVSENSPVRISASSLDEFMLCPVHWLHRKMHWKTDPLYIQSFSPINKGNWLHWILANLFAENLEQALKTLQAHKALTEIVQNSKAQKIYPALLDFMVEQYTPVLDSVIQEMQSLWPHHLVYAVEKKYEFKISDLCIMEGKLDLILQNPETEQLVVIDFKTGAIPNNKSISGKSRKSDPIESSRIEKHQIFFYASLLQKIFEKQDDLVIESLNFIQIPNEVKSKSIFPVFSTQIDAHLNEDQLLQGMQILEERVKSAAQAISQSDLRRELGTSCKQCRFPQFCRKKFWVDEQHLRARVK